jgi:Tfp pilus assembly protein PilF
MGKYRWISLILIFGLIFVGCVTLREDQRLSNKGLGEIKKGNYQEAERYLKAALSQNPNNPYAILNMGVVYFHTGRKEQARQMFDKVISLSSQEKAGQSNQDWAVGKNLVEIAEKNVGNMK